MDWQEVLCLSSGCTGDPVRLAVRRQGKAGFSIPAALVMPAACEALSRWNHQQRLFLL